MPKSDRLKATSLSVRLMDFLQNYERLEGTTPNGAIRDVLTELMHHEDFEEILIAAREVYREELELAK